MLNYDVVAEGLIRLTNWFACHQIWDNTMAFTQGPIFEESYEIRAAIISGRVLDFGKGRGVAHAFCDRAVTTQGVAEENMYFMGYANQRNDEGIPACSCVADASSTAQVLVDAVQAYPDSPKKETYIGSLRSFVDYVLGKYATKDGVIGVGILNHKINPWPEYWCANALFTPIMVGFAEITGEEKYMDAAVGPLEFLSRFDYTKRTESNSGWATSPTELILYTSEGLLAGLLSPKMQSRLDKTPKGFKLSSSVKNDTGKFPTDADNRLKAEAEKKKAAHGAETLQELLEGRWNEFAEWLHANQEPTGPWQDSKHYRAYQLGLSWLMLQACRTLDTNRFLEACVDRQLTYLLSQEAKSFFGMFCRPFASATAHLSFAYAAEICLKEDPDRFAKALSEAQRNAADNLW